MFSLLKFKKEIVIALIVLVCAGVYFFGFSAPGGTPAADRVIVPLGTDTPGAIQLLKERGAIRSALLFRLFVALTGKEVIPGGYRIDGNRNIFSVFKILSSPPYMRWTVVPEGLRKEQIAELLHRKLDWGDKEEKDFLSAYTLYGKEYQEGYYFPETYLIPVEENGSEVAKRMFDKFNEIYAPLYPLFLKENIKTATAVKIASLVQREAAGKDDMPLISGIIWNRLLTGMKLDIDATLQYVQGKVGDEWWAPIHGPDARKLVSPYNTYLNKGLPPTAITNPGLAAITAVLKPAKTDCLYYLHDSERQIHCAKTFEEHKKNIEKYL